MTLHGILLSCLAGTPSCFLDILDKAAEQWPNCKLQTPLSTQPGSGTKPYYKSPGGL